jgi:hypothetical protein
MDSGNRATGGFRDVTAGTWSIRKVRTETSGLRIGAFGATRKQSYPGMNTRCRRRRQLGTALANGNGNPAGFFKPPNCSPQGIDMTEYMIYTRFQGAHGGSVRAWAAETCPRGGPPSSETRSVPAVPTASDPRATKRRSCPRHCVLPPSPDRRGKGGWGDRGPSSRGSARPGPVRRPLTQDSVSAGANPNSCRPFSLSTQHSALSTQHFVSTATAP